MEFYESARTIAASPEAIWTILTDADAYTDWDNGVAKIEGAIQPGGKFKIYAELSPERAFPTKVTEFVPHKKMTWTGGMPLGLFKGVRTFTLSPSGDGTTAFHMREEFTGPMLAMIWKKMPDLGPSFEQFAEGLKQRAESS